MGADTFVDTNLQQLDRGFSSESYIQSSARVFGGGSDSANQFLNYVQSLSPETIAQLSRPASADVFHVMERNIIGLLGALPPEGFEVTVTTNREDLGRLLASAMMSGYFLHNAEQRMAFESSLVAAEMDASTAE